MMGATPAGHGADLPVRRSQLVGDLRRLGVSEAGAVMVHASMSRLGWVVGGTQTVIQALLDVVGPGGTLLAYVGWEDMPFDLAQRSPDWQDAYRREMPPFDPALSQAWRGCGQLAERLRTWPGSCRSDHPEANFVALGARAGWLTADQDRDDPYGPSSPLGRLVEADGQLLLLGAPLTTMTLLHHAESIVDLPGKRRVRYEVPIRRGSEVIWETYADIDTTAGALPYEQVVNGDVDRFVTKVVTDAQLGVFGEVGAAQSWLVGAREFTGFAVAWLIEHFG